MARAPVPNPTRKRTSALASGRFGAEHRCGAAAHFGSDSCVRSRRILPFVGPPRVLKIAVARAQEAASGAVASWYVCAALLQRESRLCLLRCLLLRLLLADVQLVDARCARRVAIELLTMLVERLDLVECVEHVSQLAVQHPLVALESKEWSGECLVV